MNTLNTYDKHEDLVKKSPENPNVDGKTEVSTPSFIKQQDQQTNGVSYSNEPFDPPQADVGLLAGLKEKLLEPTQAEMTS